MGQFYIKLKKISNYLNSIIKVIIFLMLAAMTIIITAQIICRVFFTALSWTEGCSYCYYLYSRKVKRSKAESH